MSTVTRMTCPSCGAQCIDRELNCWQCGSLLKPADPATDAEATVQVSEAKPALAPQRVPFWSRAKPVAPPKPLNSDELINFDGLTAAELPVVPGAEPAAARRTRTTLTGEIIEAPEDEPANQTAATIGETTLNAADEQPIFVISFCRNCGYQNEEGVRECARCKNKLEIVNEPPPEVEPLPRAWGFDVLGAAWIVLGIAAIVCGQFLLKATPNQREAALADYFWTGVVVCVPGVLVFLRHTFCKVMFWVMTLGSILVWAVIGFLWLFVGGLEPYAIGLWWLAILSALSIISFATVRLNDAFDFSF